MTRRALTVLSGIALILLLAGCGAAPTPPPTQVPPTPVPPSATLPPPADTATLVPPSATPAPPTDTAVPPTAAATTDPHVPGADCKACHTAEHLRWSNTLHAATTADVLTNEEHNKSELLIDDCIGCHAPFQAATFHIGDFVQPVNQVGPWKIVEANASKWEMIKCEVCHDPTSKAQFKLAFWDPAKQAYVSVKDATELCEKCHQAGTDDSRDLAGSVHQGLTCATCHFQKGTEMSLDPHQACANCHPSVNPKHPDVTKLDTTYLNANSANNIHFIKCSTCHPNGTPTPAP